MAQTGNLSLWLQFQGKSRNPIETSKFHERNRYELIKTSEQIYLLRCVDCQHRHLLLTQQWDLCHHMQLHEDIHINTMFSESMECTQASSKRNAWHRRNKDEESEKLQLRESALKKKKSAGATHHKITDILSSKAWWLKKKKKLQAGLPSQCHTTFTKVEVSPVTQSYQLLTSSPVRLTFE